MKNRAVTLVIYSLRLGGAERVLSFVANTLAADGMEVRVVTFAPRDEAPFYFLDPRVRLENLGLAGSSRNLRGMLTRTLFLRKTLLATRPAVVVSFMHTMNVAVLAALLGSRVPVIVSERTNPRYGPAGKGWRVLRTLAYPMARCVVVLNDRCAAWFRFLPPSRLRVISNPVFAPERDPSLSVRKKVILGVGRLDPVKRFDRLIRAFAAVARELPDWTVVLHGDGPQREPLQELIGTLGLGGRVTLAGTTRDPGAAMLEASIFALTSRYEGFPNALSEAMACGMAVAAMDCETGPRELITPGVDGLLVPAGDVEALAAALLLLARDPEKRALLGGNARRITDKFSPEAIGAQWRDLLAGYSGSPP
jgi:GalNAc-alpha-(1->4)-GalNAc-alpha-(1->3)-diNAcBac-PP-undecaprenol alpha-1,4-N-acetyl-D-galactosaminyltransferase